LSQKQTKKPDGVREEGGSDLHDASAATNLPDRGGPASRPLSACQIDLSEYSQRARFMANRHIPCIRGLALLIVGNRYKGNRC
jgi:hypothetical protein